jgi:hypothetical protein
MAPGGASTKAEGKPSAFSGQRSAQHAGPPAHPCIPPLPGECHSKGTRRGRGQRARGPSARGRGTTAATRRTCGGSKRPASWGFLCPGLGHLMSPPITCRLPLGSPPRRARRDVGVYPLGPPPALRRRGLPPLTLGPSQIPAGALKTAVTRPFPPPQGSDTIPIACRPAVQFAPFCPAGASPRSGARSTWGPPDKGLFVRVTIRRQ